MRRAPPVLEQAIDDVDGGEGLARPGGHLDQRTRIGLGKGPLEVADGAGLDRPQAGFVQGRQLPQPSAQGQGLVHPCPQRLGPREVEDRAAPRHRVEPVGEVGYGAVGLEQEGQGGCGKRGALRRHLRHTSPIAPPPRSGFPPPWLRWRRRSCGPRTRGSRRCRSPASSGTRARRRRGPRRDRPHPCPGPATQPPPGSRRWRGGRVARECHSSHKAGLS